LIIKVFVCWDHPLVSISGDADTFIYFCPFREVYPPTSSRDLFVTNFPITTLPSLWPSKPLATYHLRTVIDLYLWPFFLISKTNNQMYWLKFCPLRGLFFTTVLQKCPRRGLECYSCSLYSDAWISCPIISEPGPRLFFLCKLIEGTPHEAIGAGWESEGSVTWVGTMGIWATPSCNLCFQDMSWPDSTCFDDGMLLCTLNFMARWVR